MSCTSKELVFLHMQFVMKLGEELYVCEDILFVVAPFHSNTRYKNMIRVCCQAASWIWKTKCTCQCSGSVNPNTAFFFCNGGELKKQSIVCLESFLGSQAGRFSCKGRKRKTSKIKPPTHCILKGPRNQRGGKKPGGCKHAGGNPPMEGEKRELL